MKYLTLLLFMCLVISACGKKTDDNQTGQPVKWELVWSDDFLKDGLPDPAIWDYETGYVRNQEAQYYTRQRWENARVENGNLVIEARKDNWDGHEITASSLHTYGKKHIKYGKIEVRAKLPAGKGTWPAIWMLGTSFRNGTKWPDCGEIDIMENVGFDPDIIHANIHTKAYNHVLKTNKGDKITILKPSDDFHVFSLEWYTNRMDFFVDGIKYFSFQKEEGWEKWPFDKECYLIINLAIGGSWGGQQGIDQSIFPQKYYIDYVKVYKQTQ